MLICLLVEVLAGESEIEDEDSESRRILVPRKRAKRLCMVPPPYGLLRLVGDQSRRVQMIGVYIINLRRGGG